MGLGTGLAKAKKDPRWGCQTSPKECIKVVEKPLTGRGKAAKTQTSPKECVKEKFPSGPGKAAKPPKVSKQRCQTSLGVEKDAKT